MRTKSKVLIAFMIAFVMSLALAAASLTAFAAPVPENAVHSHFNVQWGDWEQYRNVDNGEGDQQLAALSVKNLFATQGASVSDKAFIVSDKLNTSESFKIEFETAIPSADSNTVGSVGFFARASVDANSGSKVIDNMSGFLVEIFKDNMRIVYHGENGEFPLLVGSPFASTVTAGDFVKVQVEVKTDSVAVKLFKGETELSAATCSSGVKFAPDLKAGFSVEKTKALESGKFAGSYGVFRNIVYTAGESVYKAYPFAASATEPGDVSPTEELNPNFATTSGAFLGAEDGSFVSATALHEAFSNAAMISKFGGVYGESFDLTYNVCTPTKAEAEATGAEKMDANAGFYFRASVSNDLYSGIYVRVEYSSIMIVNGKNAEGKLETKSYFFAETIPFGTRLTIHIKVDGDNIAIDVKNGDATVKLKETKDAATGADSVSAKANIKYDAKLVAGFACDKMMGKFSNVVMTAGAKEFKAYPFDAGKTLPEKYKDFTVVGTGMTRQDLTNENAANIREDDKELIGSEFGYILYAQYDGKAHDLSIAMKDGSELEGFTAKFEYRLPPNWEYYDWCQNDSHKTDANRHGMSVTILDSDGYAYVRQLFAYKIYAVEVTLEGVVATNRAYDGTMEVEIGGGSLKGILDCDKEKVGFKLGTGIAAQADIGTGIAVTIDANNAVLTGDKAGNYLLKLPDYVKVDITKGKAAAPEGELFAEDRTENSITVGAIYNAEFSLDGKTWQDSNVFENLKAGTEYTVYARIKGNANQDASDAVSINVKTSGKAGGGGCGGEVMYSAGAVAVILLAVAVFALKRKKTN